MSSKRTPQRRWWNKQQPQVSEAESAAGFSDESGAIDAEEQITVGSMTKEELCQLISETVERTLEEFLPKQLARQRTMMETELKWYLNELMKDVTVVNGVDAANTVADDSESDPVPKLNPSIDWSFLE